MAWQAAPTTTANNANQNAAQESTTFAVGPITPIWQTMQAAPSPIAINQTQLVGYPLG